MFPFRKYRTVTPMMIMRQNLHLFSFPLLLLAGGCEKDTCVKLSPLMQLSQKMIIDEVQQH
jgi:hypothetical protein